MTTIRIKKLFSLFAMTFLVMVFFNAQAFATAFNDPGTRRSAGAGASGDLVPVESQVNGGEITIGATAQVVVLFRNDSGRPLETGAIQLYPSSTVSAEVSLNQCSQEALPAGASCAIAMSVKGLQTGAWRIEMIMRHSGRSRLVTATLGGAVATGDGGDDQFISDIEAIPSELDFGELDTSQSVVRALVLRNTTSERVEINAIYVEASSQSGYNIRSDCDGLDPGQACIITITWTPVLKGDASGVLIVEHSGPTSVASVNMEGQFEPDITRQADTFPEASPGKGLLVASQQEIDFGNDVDSSVTITTSLVNVGDVAMTLRDVRLAGSDSAGLSISSDGCQPETVLEPVEACALTLSWSPIREGAVLDDVHILHDGARGVLVLPVRGTASGVVSQDSKSVRLGGSVRSSGAIAGSGSNSSSGSGGDDMFIQRDDSIDPGSVLDGFVVTSHSSKRSIISGPGGSRIVFNGEEVVIGGFLWYVSIRPSGVAFRSGDEQVLLLFDRSLSSVNRDARKSGRGASSN